MPQSKRPAGFTLIELLMVCAAIGILAAIAYPSYQEHLRRTARTDAKTALMQNAQFLERNFTEAGRYDLDSAGAAVVLPYPSAPMEGTAKYAVTVAAAQASYALSAAPIAGRTMAGDACGTFTLNQLGQKGLSGATLDVAACWNR